MTEDLLAATERPSERVSAVQWRQLASSHLHHLRCEDRPCRRRHRFKNRVLYDLSIHNNRNRHEAELMRFE